MEKLGLTLFAFLMIFSLSITLIKGKPGPEHTRPDFMLYIINDSTVGINHHFEWIDTIPINDIEEYVKWESNIDN